MSKTDPAFEAWREQRDRDEYRRTRQIQAIADVFGPVAGMRAEREQRQKRGYVATSWRNPNYEPVVIAMREAGYRVHDWKVPPFHWSEIDPDYAGWTAQAYIEALHHPAAETQFANDIEGIASADVVVLLLPCGASAHAEAAWARAHGKPVIVMLDSQPRPELLHKLFDTFVTNIPEMLTALARATRVLHPQQVIP